MARRAIRASRFLAIGTMASSLLLGCGQREPAVPQAAAPAAGGSEEAAIVQAARLETRLHQPFAAATVADQPDQYLPDKTLTGKSVGKLYEDVVHRWDRISFLNANGQRLHYTAVLETELGMIEIDLLSDVAPNHVRSFVALIQAGYYDGLLFERTIVEQAEIVDDGKVVETQKVERIEGGCPTGTGNPGYGSLGYWLKPEVVPELKHEEGTVGACLGEEPDSAACRFYIMLSKAPVIDGERTIFGKVTRGLDVVRRIATQPVINSPEYPQGDRPEKPVVIRKASVRVLTESVEVRK
jgi:peptidyl-prolyl cis-trans isomerase B (cyclophilin B)